MQAYMKSAMPFLGVPAAGVRATVRAAVAERRLESAAELQDVVRALWDGARYREERYAALAVLARYERWATLPLLERLVVEGAWWDYVDTLAHRVGELLRRDPSIAGELRAWARDPSRWKRRAAIIAQLGGKEQTDVALLVDTIEANLDDRDFFVRKAIGWALREHSKTDAAWVVDFVREHEERLSPLSRREALKWLHHSGLLPAGASL